MNEDVWLWCALVCYVAGSLLYRAADGGIRIHTLLLDAAGSVLGSVWSVRAGSSGHRVFFVFFVTLTAFSLWRWWINGGGDGLKKWTRSRDPQGGVQHD